MADSHGGTSSAKTVLFVCSANLCRSVMAAHYADQTLRRCEPGQRWQIVAAGTEVSPENRLPAPVERAMNGLGIPTDAPPRPATPDLIRSADLILVAQRWHRSAIARLFPAAMSTTFTILQFRHLIEAGRAIADDDTTDHLELARIGQLHQQPLAVTDHIDITDPVRAGTEPAVWHTASVIHNAIESIFRTHSGGVSLSSVG